MKTSELMQKLKDLKRYPRLSGSVIEVFSTPNGRTPWFTIGDIHYSEPFFQTGEHGAFRTLHKDVIDLIIEYISTPREERQDELKYKLRCDDNFIESTGYYLNLKLDFNKYSFNTNDNTPHHKTIFTQSEIDKMPFDTNFFVKEEVK